jgi:hypothetical protein
MSHRLAEFPAHRTQAGRTPPTRYTQSRSYHVDELHAAPSPRQNRRYILRTFLLAPVLVALAIYTIVQMPHLLARTNALLNGAGVTPSAGADSFFASASYWVPILLVLLSAAVLLCMGFLALRGRSRKNKPRGPELVQTPSPAHTLSAGSQGPPMAEAAAALATASSRPFLVPRNERRHAAQEEIRLSRDARTSAEVRAFAASRLRIRAASPSHQPLEAEEPNVRFRVPPKRREAGRNRPQAAYARSSDTSPDSPPPAIA